MLAAWFHDAVHNPPRGDNEDASAALARQVRNDGTITVNGYNMVKGRKYRAESAPPSAYHFDTITA